MAYFHSRTDGSSWTDAGAVFTNRRGRFGRDVSDAILSATRNGGAPESPTEPISVSAVDPAAGFLWGLSAPVGATTVSPLTTVIEGSGNQAWVASALRLFEGSQPISNGRNLLIFDAGGARAADASEARDAARLTSVNLQLLGVAILLSAGSGDDSTQTDAFGIYEGLARFGQFIAQSRRGDLRSAAEMEQLIRSMDLIPGVSDGAIRAAAELLADYATAVPTLVDDVDVAGRFETGLVFDIMPKVMALVTGRGEAIVAEVRARTPASIASDFAVYANMPRQLAETLIVAGPDYREVPPGGEIVLRSDFGEDYNLRPLWSNDWLFFADLGIGTATSPVIDQISIDSAFAGRISVSPNPDGTLRIAAAPGFHGLASFDYRVRNNGASAIGRVFVRVR